MLYGRICPYYVMSGTLVYSVVVLARVDLPYGCPHDFFFVHLTISPVFLVSWELPSGVIYYLFKKSNSDHCWLKRDDPHEIHGAVPAQDTGDQHIFGISITEIVHFTIAPSNVGKTTIATYNMVNVTWWPALGYKVGICAATITRGCTPDKGVNNICLV
jgi:hypothetical protein